MSSITRGRTEAETAGILHVKVETLAAWRSRGVGPRYRKYGKVIDYPDEFIAEGFLRPHARAGASSPSAPRARR
jgi:hypothetical protein